MVVVVALRRFEQSILNHVRGVHSALQTPVESQANHADQPVPMFGKSLREGIRVRSIRVRIGIARRSHRQPGCERSIERATGPGFRHILVFIIVCSL